MNELNRLSPCRQRLLDFLVENRERMVTYKELGEFDPVFKEIENIHVYICIIRKTLIEGRIVVKPKYGCMYTTKESVK